MQRWQQIVVVSMLVLSGCGGGNTKPENILLIPVRARYADEIVVKTEYSSCKLEQRVANAARSAARAGFDRVKVVPMTSPQMVGKVLTLEITNVSGVDRALYDQEAITIRGVLYENGQEKASFMARRRTSRRVLQIKTTCGMLENNIDELKDDMKKWFAAPTLDARMGNL